MEVISAPEVQAQFSFFHCDESQLASSEALFCIECKTHPNTNSSPDFRQGKADSERKESSLQLESAAYLLPHPSKVWKGGEDAHFITSKVIGVADGVGGWADMGVDPALYALKLMEGAKNAVDNLKVSDPMHVLRLAYEHSKEVDGSSTACIISIHKDKLHAAHLGDSGFMVIRDSKIMYRTKEQQYHFNFPFQLGTNSDCLPEHAEYITLDIQDGDLIILGTDGLWDNLFDETILELTQTSDNICTLAETIAAHTRHVSQSLVPTPFARAATAAGHPFALGGKLDDVSVIVALVCDTNVKAKDENTNGQS